jgi:hypothetical protein
MIIIVQGKKKNLFFNATSPGGVTNPVEGEVK